MCAYAGGVIPGGGGPPGAAVRRGVAGCAAHHALADEPAAAPGQPAWCEHVPAPEEWEI